MRLSGANEAVTRRKRTFEFEVLSRVENDMSEETLARIIHLLFETDIELAYIVHGVAVVIEEDSSAAVIELRDHPGTG